MSGSAARMFRVSSGSVADEGNLTLLRRHIHVSLRDESGHNIFSVSDEEVKAGGRKGAAYDDVRFLSQEAEWFLAGLLEGLPDGECQFCVLPVLTNRS